MLPEALASDRFSISPAARGGKKHDYHEAPLETLELAIAFPRNADQAREIFIAA